MKTNMSNETKHTPGPWEISGDMITNSFGNIAELQTLDGFMRGGSKSGNARLIAAAPELLEALKDAVDNLHAEGFDNDPKDGGNPAMMAEFRAAIAKAEGRA